jgi:DUF1680 family protein
VLAGSAGSLSGAELKFADNLERVRLTHAELSGEIGRRIHDLIYKNYMVLNLDRDFLDPFRNRPPLKEGASRYIGIGKVIDAGSMFSAYTDDPQVLQRTGWLIEELMKTRDADGYLGHIPAQPEARQNYIRYILHDQEYVILSLVDHWCYCGDAKSLEYARQLANYVMPVFLRQKEPERVCSAALPEALLKLYGGTGDRRYLDFAANTRLGGPNWIEGDSLCHWDKGPLDRKTLLDHKTSHVYLNLNRCFSQTLLYRWQPDDNLLKMSRFILQELTRSGGNLFVIGSASENEHFSYRQDGRGNTSESCVTAYLIRWLESLMRLEGDMRYGDLMERSIYNALFAAQDPAGRKLRYFTPFEGPRKYYAADGFCCPGNYRRIVAELPEMVYYGTRDGGIAVNLFTASRKKIETRGGRGVTMQQQTDYPASGLVKMTVSPSEAFEFPLRLRIPRWCSQAKLTINEEAPVTLKPGKDFCEIRRVWRPGDTATLEMPMPWRVVFGHSVQEGRVALMRGPVVYCLGSEANAELLKKYPEPGELMVDPQSLGEPVADSSVRPQGLKVAAKAWVPGSNPRYSKPTLDVVFTEFIDPTGTATYFFVPDLTKGVEDELLKEP